MSVDQLFDYSSNICRLGIDPIEVIHRPQPEADVFRSAESGAFAHPGFAETKATDIALAQQPVLFGLAWRGQNPFDDAESPLAFEMVKTVEWRPAPIAGLTHATPKVHSVISPLTSAIKLLDDNVPGWNERIVAGSKSYASEIAALAQAGSQRMIKSVIGGFISASNGDSGLPFITGKFPRKGKGGRRRLTAKRRRQPRRRRRRR